MGCSDLVSKTMILGINVLDWPFCDELLLCILSFDFNSALVRYSTFARDARWGLLLIDYLTLRLNPSSSSSISTMSLISMTFLCFFRVLAYGTLIYYLWVSAIFEALLVSCEGAYYLRFWQSFRISSTTSLRSFFLLMFILVISFLN